MLVLVCGCGNSVVDENEKVIEDGLGVYVNVPAIAKRIVAMDIGASENVMLLTSHKRIVAVSYFLDDPGICNLYRYADDIPGRVNQNVEHILSLHPDLIFITLPGKEELYEQLKRVGLTVVAIRRPQNMADVKKNLELIGEALSEKKRALEIISKINLDLNCINEVVKSVSEADRKRVLRMSSVGAGGGRNSTVDGIINHAGCINVAAEMGLMEGVLADELVSICNADIFLMPTWDYRGNRRLDALAERYMDDLAFRNIPAVQNKNFVYVPDYFVLSQSPYRLFAIKGLLEAAYGVHFDSQLEEILPSGSVRKYSPYIPRFVSSNVNKD